jgi:hypothetical protein
MTLRPQTPFVPHSFRPHSFQTPFVPFVRQAEELAARLACPSFHPLYSAQEDTEIADALMRVVEEV